METAAIITCTECTKRFKGKASLAGKKIKCPFCKEAFVVPRDIAGPAAPPENVKAEPKKAFKFDDEDDDPNPYAVTALDIAPRCPNCANLMADEKAFICLFCGYNTLTRSWGKTEKVIGHTTGDYASHQMVAYICSGILIVLTIALVFLSLVFPYILEPGTWQEYLDHESLRLWLTIILLFIFFPTGMLVYKRLIVNPTPPEKVKE